MWQRIRSVLRRPVTYALFVVLCLVTFSTQWLFREFEGSCPNSGNMKFHMTYCSAAVERVGDVHIQFFDLTDTPTSILRFLQDPLLVDREYKFELVTLFERGSYVLNGWDRWAFNVSEVFFYAIDVAWLLFVSAFVVSGWSHWRIGKKIGAVAVLIFLYTFPISLIFVAGRLGLGPWLHW